MTELIPVNAPGLLTMFASAAACIDRLSGAEIPTEVVEIVDDPKPQRHSRIWSRADDELLLAMWRGGAGGGAMADMLHRTCASIWSRIDVIKWGAD